MKCPICKHGETTPCLTTVTLERDGMAAVFRGVPGEVCDNCGETFHDGAVTAALLQQAEQAAAAGVEEQFSYVSTAGGAFLEWMEGKTLPGVAALIRAA